MKRSLILLLMLLGVVAGANAQYTVSGHVVMPNGQPPTNSRVVFTLQNYKPQAPKVSGFGQIQTQYSVIPDQITGAFSTPLFGNDVIQPNQTTWRVDFLANNVQQYSEKFIISASCTNIDTCIPAIDPPSSQYILGAKTYEFTQATPASTWTIVHMFGDSNVVFDCYDLTNHYLIPDTVVQTDVNTLTITFVAAQTGKCTVMTGNNVVLTTAPANALVSNPTSTQTVNTQPFVLQGPFTSAGPNTLNGATTFGGVGVFNSGLSVAGGSLTTTGVINLTGAGNSAVQTALNNITSGQALIIPCGTYTGPNLNISNISITSVCAPFNQD